MSNNILNNLSNSKFFTTMIGKDQQQPSINLTNYDLDFIIMMLHKRISLENIKKTLGLEDTDLGQRLNLLEKEGLIEKKRCYYIFTKMHGYYMGRFRGNVQ